MKKLYCIIGLLISMLLTGYLFVHISYMHRGYTRLMGFYGLEDNTIDVAFVGTSVTFSSFMPMEIWNEYGIAAYDYCTNVQFENSLRHSVKEIMKTQSPKLIVIDVAPFILQHSAGQFPEGENRELFIKYNIDSMSYSFNRIQLIQEINQESNGDMYSFLYYVFDICRYHTNKPSWEKHDNAYNDVTRGYGYLRRNGSSKLDTVTFFYDDGNEKSLEGCHQVYFDDLVSYTDQLECEVVFYCAPVIFVDNQKGIDWCARKNHIKRILEEKGYTFWDLSLEVEAIGLDYDYDFWSYDHFDSLGAEKITKYISKRIIDTYDIPDRRNDAQYSNWNDDYQSWILIKEEYNNQDLDKE